MNTATIFLHRQNALIKFRELKNLVSIMKWTITLLRKVLVISHVVRLPSAMLSLPVAAYLKMFETVGDNNCSLHEWLGTGFLKLSSYF
jgi:hypothetical protein